MLAEEGLVNERIIRAIRAKYHDMLDAHNKCFAAADCKGAIDPEVVYFHLKQQGRVVDRSTPKVHSGDKVARVDMSNTAGRRLPGYDEWVRDYWTGEGPSAAEMIQRLVRQHHARQRFHDALDALKEEEDNRRRSLQQFELTLAQGLFDRDARDVEQRPPPQPLGSLEV